MYTENQKKHLINFRNNIVSFLKESNEIVEKTYKKYPLLQKQNNLSINTFLIESAIAVIEIYDILEIQKFMKFFIENGFQYWDKIKERDNNFLATSLSSIFNNDYVNDLSFFFGKNKERKIYIDDETIQYFWDLFSGIVHNSIKYLYYRNSNELLNFDLNKEIQKWGVKIE